jgi:hypothetical protein
MTRPDVIAGYSTNAAQVSISENYFQTPAWDYRCICN